MNAKERRRMEALEAALSDFIDGEVCHLDHHGYCQTHGLSKPCRVQTAINLLSESADRREVHCGSCDTWYPVEWLNCRRCESMSRRETRPSRGAVAE